MSELLQYPLHHSQPLRDPGLDDARSQFTAANLVLASLFRHRTPATTAW